MASTHLASRTPTSYSSQSPSSGNMSGGKIAAIVVGTILAVGVVCLLIFWPQLVFRSRKRTFGSGNGQSKEVRPERPGRASGNDGNGNGVDDAGSRRRRTEEADGRGGRAQRRCNHIMASRSSGSPVVINNNIYVNPNDYLHPLPALNSPQNRGAAAPGIATTQRNAQASSGVRNVRLSPPPNRGLPPHRRRTRGESPAGPPVWAPASAHTEAGAPGCWDVADWARRVAPGQTPHSPAPRGSAAGSFVRERARSPARRRGEGSSTRARTLHIPGAFPRDRDLVERFQLVTAPARAHAPRAPSHGDDGFWVREARESRWEREEREERRERLEREERRERRERDRYDREERRERDRLEREERRERQEREERRERQGGLGRWRDV